MQTWWRGDSNNDKRACEGACEGACDANTCDDTASDKSYAVLGDSTDKTTDFENKDTGYVDDLDQEISVYSPPHRLLYCHRDQQSRRVSADLTEAINTPSNVRNSRGNDCDIKRRL